MYPGMSLCAYCAPTPSRGRFGRFHRMLRHFLCLGAIASAVATSNSSAAEWAPSTELMGGVFEHADPKLGIHAQQRRAVRTLQAVPSGCDGPCKAAAACYSHACQSGKMLTDGLFAVCAGAKGLCDTYSRCHCVSCLHDVYCARTMQVLSRLGVWRGANLVHMPRPGFFLCNDLKTTRPARADRIAPRLCLSSRKT